MSKSAYPGLVEALSSFKDYGFTQLQAAAYIAILKLGEDTGSAIAKESGINRSKIYDTLNQLEEMGAVRVISRENRPRYVAINPDKVFGDILNNFTIHLDNSKTKLMSVITDQVNVDPVTMTITTLKLKNLNVNEYDYLISSSVKSRGKFLEQLKKDNLPGYNVKILDLNDFVNLGLVMLLNDDEVLIFPTPTGSTVTAIKLEDVNISKFMLGIIESWWLNDIPEYISDEINAGNMIGLHVGKTLSMRYQLKDGRDYAFDRPVSYLITDTHISFFYEGQENPKINLRFLKDVVNLEDGGMNLVFRNFENKLIGELLMYPVEKSIFLKNILLMVARLANK